MAARKSMERGSRGDGRAVEVGTGGIEEDGEGGRTMHEETVERRVDRM